MGEVRSPGSEMLRATITWGVLLIAAGPAIETAAIELETPIPSGGSQAAPLAVNPCAPLGPVSLEVPEPLQGAPGISTNFLGFGYDDNATETGAVSIPPDPMGAAGPDRLVAVVNSMIEARSKSGVLLWRDSLADFFAPRARRRARLIPRSSMTTTRIDLWWSLSNGSRPAPIPTQGTSPVSS